jgi:hypothetical protein
VFTRSDTAIYFSHHLSLYYFRGMFCIVPCSLQASLSLSQISVRIQSLSYCSELYLPNYERTAPTCVVKRNTFCFSCVFNEGMYTFVGCNHRQHSTRLEYTKLGVACQVYRTFPDLGFVANPLSVMSNDSSHLLASALHTSFAVSFQIFSLVCNLLCYINCISAIVWWYGEYMNGGEMKKQEVV